MVVMPRHGGSGFTHALIYHDVVAATGRDAIGFGGLTAARYKLDPGDFERHLGALASAGAGVGIVRSGAPWPQAALTFDDGGASAPAVADALEARGWRGHFLVTTERIGTPGFVTAEQVRDLAARGHAVGSHSHSHPKRMSALSAPQLDLEWERSRAILAELLDGPPELASVPGGFVSEPVVHAAAAAGYRVLMTSEPSSRPRTHGGMAVLGRYAIWAGTSPDRAAAYVGGSGSARAQLWLAWNAKGVAKRLTPQLYAGVRRLRARR